MRKFLTLTLCLVAMLAFGFAMDTTQAQDDELTEVTLLLNWVPYGEHVGFYYGLGEGFYEEEGIALSILPGGGSGRTVQAVAADQATFGYADTPALINGINAGAEIRSIGVFLQQTPSAIQFFCDTGIETIEDIVGKSVAITAGDALSQTMPALMAANDLSMDDVETVNLDPSGKTAALLSGQVDSLVGFANGQAPTIESVSGRDVCLLRYSDWGVNFLALGLFTSNDLIESDPELVSAFLRATIRSWTEAADNIDEATQSMSDQVVEAPSFDELRSQWELTIDLFHTETTAESPIGVNAEEDWQATLDIMTDFMDLEDAQDIDVYWDASFGEEIGMMEDDSEEESES